LVAAEASRAVGTLQVLPATAGEIVEPEQDDFPEVPAMMAEGPVGEAPPSLSELVQGAIGDKKTSSSSEPNIDGDPDVAYAFELLIGEVSYAMFTEVGGLSWKAEAIPVRSGGNNEHGYNMRGPGKFEPLTLKRGWFAANGEFYVMLKASLAGSTKSSQTGADRTNLTINVKNRAYKTVGQYNVFNAFIIEYSGLQLNSMSSAVGFESIRMAYDYFTYKKA
jgi:phage tail-like protein